MDQQNTAELNRRTLLKGAAVGATLSATLGGAAELLTANPAQAADKKALADSGITTETVTFKNGADDIRGFLARPKAAGKYGTVLLIPGITGVDGYIKETTAQLAQAGLAALALDFYSRKGGAPETTDFAVLRSFVTENAPDKQIVSDGMAALAYLKAQPFTNGKYGVTGFCMGGRITLLLAAHSADFVAASPYYGPVKAGGPTNIAPMEHVGKIKAAVQGHYGGTDMNPKPEDVEAFYAELKKTNPHGEYFIYEGAGHAFHTFTRAASYNEAAADKAWGRTLEFFKKHLSA
jgi:carboxymethylenebutenolidase